MSDSIGQQLQKAREALRLSLEQASQLTRIKRHYLQALESDNFDALPSKVQQRGFLRSYAELLKLPVEPLLSQWNGEMVSADLATAETERVTINPSFGKDSIASTEPARRDSQPNSAVILQELGSQLRRQREALGLTLEHVEQQIHVRLHYLQALENGSLENLPSPVQGRGMLNNYAVFLGIEPEPVLLHYAEGLQANLKSRQEAERQKAARAAGKPASPKTGLSRNLPGPLRRFFSWDLWVGAFLIVFLVGFVAWAGLRISQMQSGQSPTATAPSIVEVLAPDTPTATPSAEIANTTPEPTDLAETSLATATLSLAGTETTATEEPTPDLSVASSGKIQLYLVARQRAWARITVDGKVELEGRVVPGSAYLFTGEKRIELLTGNGAALQVFLNRQDLGPLGIYGEVVQRVFTPQGMQTPTPAIPPTPTLTPTPPASETPAVTGTPATPTPVVGTLTPTNIRP
jgi:cytoskeletal protein RodZ